MHVVIFRSTRSTDEAELYAEWGAKTSELVRTIPGYISHVGFWDKDTRKGVTIGYFESEEAITLWRDNPDHGTARELGKAHFYEEFTLEVAKVERSYSWSKSGGFRHG